MDAALIDIIIEDAKSYRTLEDFLAHAVEQAAFERDEVQIPAKQREQDEDFRHKQSSY